MELNFDDLYHILTEQGLIAADRMCTLLSQHQDSQWYEEFFQANVNALKPIVMCDHEIGIEARQKLIGGVVERMGLGEDIMEQVGRVFAQFVGTEASPEFRVFFQDIDTDHLWSHIREVTPHTQASFFYKLLPELADHAHAFQVLSRAAHELTLHSIRTRSSNKQWRLVDSDTSKTKAMERVVERIEHASIPNLQQTRQALDLLQNHHNFLFFANHLLLIEHTNYDNHTKLERQLFNLENQLPDHFQHTIKIVHAETLALLEKFHPIALRSTSRLWADKVAQRCRNLLDHMQNAPDEIYTTVVVSKSSIEERRAKDEQIVHVAGFKS